MRLYLTWAPKGPDPLYHKPELTPLRKKLPPVGIPVDGYMISLSWLIGPKRINKFAQETEAKGLHRVLNFDGPIILDSGGFHNLAEIYTQEDVLEFQAKFKPDVVIHLDKKGDVRTTIKNAKIAKQLEKSYNFKIYYVITGNSLSEYLTCIKKLLKIGCENFAIGNLAFKSMIKMNDDVINIVTKIRKLIGEKALLHVLGVNNPNIIRSVSHLINSVDSSAPILLATVEKSVLFIENGSLKHILIRQNRDTNKYKNKCECPVCGVGFNVFIDEHKLPFGTGERQFYRALRAIHNAFITKKWVEDYT
jgi:tRNA-guanine family transglycosylase